MRLSIIIPVYNVERYISKCLESVIDQDLDPEDYEIIVVNDETPDESFLIAQKFADRHANIRLVDKKNGGVSTARNAGIDVATGKYIYFLDSDDFLLPNSLKNLIETCESNDLDILTFRSASFSALTSDDECNPQKHNNSNLYDQDLLSEIVTGKDYVAYLSYGGEVWLYIINHNFLKTSGTRFIEGVWLEDAVFTLSLFLNAKRMAHLKFDAHRYRVSPESAMTNKEPNHYVKIIKDLLHAAVSFDPIIKKLNQTESNPDCIARVKARQESFVFFSMVRMYRSVMSMTEVKQRINEVRNANAYPMNAFIGDEYKGLKYQSLVRLFNNERLFYLSFKILNPMLRRIHK